jgi:hypothetical protein
LVRPLRGLYPVRGKISESHLPAPLGLDFFT